MSGVHEISLWAVTLEIRFARHYNKADYVYNLLRWLHGLTNGKTVSNLELCCLPIPNNRFHVFKEAAKKKREVKLERSQSKNI